MRYLALSLCLFSIACKKEAGPTKADGKPDLVHKGAEGQLSVSTPEVEGGHKAEKVIQTFNGHRAEIYDCFARVHPAKTGSYQLRFEIAASGKVEKVNEPEGELAVPAGCVAELVRKLEFSETHPPAATKVVATITYKSN
jgi:hypothetical protein